MMEVTKNAKLTEEKEKLRSKNFINHVNKDDDVYISNFIIVLKLTCTVKIASKIGLPALNKKRPRGERKDSIKSKKPEEYIRVQNY